MTTLDFDREVVALSDERATSLRKLNIGAGALHLVTGIFMLVAGDLDFDLPVSTFSINGPPGASLSDGILNEAFGIPLAIGVATFSLLSALFHLLIAFVVFPKYKSELRRGRNRCRGQPPS